MKREGKARSKTRPRPTPGGLAAQWPKADVIIGNPPFLGAKLLKPERGPDYVNTLRRAHPDVPGMADYCAYWFRKAHDHLPACSPDDPLAGRAGLVGTPRRQPPQRRPPRPWTPPSSPPTASPRKKTFSPSSSP